MLDVLAFAWVITRGIAGVEVNVQPAPSTPQEVGCGGGEDEDEETLFGCHPVVVSGADGFAGFRRGVYGINDAHEEGGLVGGVKGFFATFDGGDEVGCGAGAAHGFVGREGEGACDGAPVLVGIEFTGVLRGGVNAVAPEEAADEATSLGALEGDGDFFAGDHFSPGHLKGDDLARLEADEAVGGAFDIRCAFFHIGDAPWALEGFVRDESGVGLCEDPFWLGVIHEVEGEVEHVEEVYDGAAA